MVSIRNNIVYGPEELDIPAHLSFAQFFFDQLKKGGNNVALINGETGESMTYNELLQSSVNLAVALQRLGLGRGDVVGLCSENRLEFLVSVLAVLYCGAVLAPLNVTYTPGELVHLMKISQPKFVFTSPITAANIQKSCGELPCTPRIITFGDYEVIPGAPSYSELVKGNVDVERFEVVEVNGATDTMAVMCSSGTTGLPKGVMLTHVNFLTITRHMLYYLSAGGDMEVRVFLALIPWFHALGFITSMAVLANRLQVVFMQAFHEETFLNTIQKYKVNMVVVVPPLAVFLAKHPLVSRYDLTSLRELWCGAAPLDADTQRAVSQRTGVKAVKQGYGLTELTMACCVDLYGEKGGSCGPPAPGMRIKVVDPESGALLGAGQRGELWIRSALRMAGYMGAAREEGEALRDEDGFVRTGDVGYYDTRGRFYIVDRIKELIKYNGFQVAPAELEALLLSHSDVAECGVVGAPHPTAGELPTAFVVRTPHSQVTATELQDYVAQRVSPSKRLRGGVVFVDCIPRNAAGKVLRRALRDMLTNTTTTVTSKL